MRCRVCSQPACTKTLPYRWKSSKHQGLLLTKLCTHTSYSQLLLFPPSLFFPLSCFFLNGCLHCSLSFLLYLHLVVFQQAEVPSRRRSVADIPCPWLIIVAWRPSHAYCYLPVWVMLGDKTWTQTLTVSRPPQSQCESPLCASQDMVRWWRGAGPKNWDHGMKITTSSRHRLTCGNVAILPPLSVLLVVASQPYPADYSNLNQWAAVQITEWNPKTSWSLPSSSPISFGNNT